MQVSKQLLRLVVTLWVITSTTGCHRVDREPADQPSPNVILISIDTLRADHLGAYGYSRDTSPFLDRLAAEGILIQDAVVAAHGTTPSHASMLTSVPQEVHGVGLTGRVDDVVPASLPNLPELFQRGGYWSLAVTGGGNVGRSFGFDRGFDLFDDGARSVEDGHRRVLAHLASAPSDRPVFLFFHTYEVHSPYAAPADVAGRFGHHDSTFETTSQNLVAHAHAADALTADDLEHVRARYNEGIVHTDRVLELLFEDLRRLGRLDRALVVVTSDHGEEFGEHGGLVHRDLLYDELVRVPLIFWGSGLPPGAAAPRAATSLDIAPTLASCAGLDIVESWLGHDLMCAGTPGIDTSLQIAQYGNHRYGVRTQRWKLILSQAADGVCTELYDLHSDSAETTNVAAEEPEVVAELSGVLRRWRANLETVPQDSEPAQLDAEERQRLEALGYL